MSRRKAGRSNTELNRMVNAIDALSDFEAFREEILPALQADLKKGTPAKDIIEKYQAHAVARLVTTMLREKDATKAMAAAKDLLDRGQGKATEKKEVKHKYENLSDEQIDALLASKFEEVEDQSKEDNKDRSESDKS